MNQATPQFVGDVDRHSEVAAQAWPASSDEYGSHRTATSEVGGGIKMTGQKLTSHEVRDSSRLSDHLLTKQVVNLLKSPR